MNFNWIREIPEYEKYFTADQRDSIELLQEILKDDSLGFEVYMKLHERFEKTSIHFSSAPIMMLKKEWAVIHKHIPYNKAARTLGVSEKTIYNWREGKSELTPNSLSLKKKRGVIIKEGG